MTEGATCDPVCVVSVTTGCWHTDMPLCWCSWCGHNSHWHTYTAAPVS